jgi:hypothetical protein
MVRALLKKPAGLAGSIDLTQGEGGPRLSHAGGWFALSVAGRVIRSNIHIDGGRYSLPLQPMIILLRAANLSFEKFKTSHH